MNKQYKEVMGKKQQSKQKSMAFNGRFSLGALPE